MIEKTPSLDEEKLNYLDRLNDELLIVGYSKKTIKMYSMYVKQLFKTIKNCSVFNLT